MVLLLLLPLQSCSGIAKRPPQLRAQDPAAASAVLYVVRRRWHIDIGFAAPDPTAPLAALGERLPSAQYLLIGFGDRRYLTSGNGRFPNALLALWPGPGLLLVSGLRASPQQAFGVTNVVELRVSLAQRRAAEAFVRQSLSDSGNGWEPYANGPYPGSLYFSATTRYSALYTCNTWAAQVLQAAGLPIGSAGVVFASQLWSQVQRVALCSPPACVGYNSEDYLMRGEPP